MQLSRTPVLLPKLVLDSSILEIDAFRFEHIRLEDYQHAPGIRAPIAV